MQAFSAASKALETALGALSGASKAIQGTAGSEILCVSTQFLPFQLPLKPYPDESEAPFDTPSPCFVVVIDPCCEREGPTRSQIEDHF